MEFVVHFCTCVLSSQTLVSRSLGNHCVFFDECPEAVRISLVVNAGFCRYVHVVCKFGVFIVVEECRRLSSVFGFSFWMNICVRFISFYFSTFLFSTFVSNHFRYIPINNTNLPLSPSSFFFIFSLFSLSFYGRREG